VQTIPNVATSDDYTAACTLGPDNNAVQLIYVVANAAVVAQFAQIGTDGTTQPWGPESLLTPQSNTIQRCAGARFRSAVAGTPARIVAQLTDPADPIFGGGVPFTSTLTSSGGVSSSGAVILVTGKVSAAGVRLAGSGFTVVRIGVGQYQVTFSPALSATPALSGTVVAAGGGTFFDASGLSAAGFLGRVVSDAGALVDQDFDFLAVQVV
jgi:hypothetical protein